jgi:hypothetical protein
MGENLKVVWAEFSTLSLAVSVAARHRQAHPHPGVGVKQPI